MNTSNELVILQEALILTKDGTHDLKYELGTLLKVKMIANDNVVVEDDSGYTFLLKKKDQGQLWNFL
jgi:hypothetical protein